MRRGEAANLNRADVYLNPAVYAELEYIAIRSRKSKNAKRGATSGREIACGFPGDSPETPILGTSWITSTMT